MIWRGHKLIKLITVTDNYGKHNCRDDVDVLYGDLTWSTYHALLVMHCIQASPNGLMATVYNHPLIDD